MSKIINYGHLLPLMGVSDCFKNSSRIEVSDPGWTYTNYDIVTNDLNEELQVGQEYIINFNTIIKSIGDLPIKNLIFDVQMDYNFKIVYHGEATEFGKTIRFPNEIQTLDVDENESFQLIYTPTIPDNHLIRVSMYDGNRKVCVKYFNVLMLKRHSKYSITSDVAGSYSCISSIEKTANIYINTSLIQEIGYDDVEFKVSVVSIDGYQSKQEFKIKYNLYVTSSQNGEIRLGLGDIPNDWQGKTMQLINTYDTKCGKWYYKMDLIAGDGTIIDSASFLVETYQDFPSYQFTNESYDGTKLILGQEYTFHYVLTSTDHQIHSDCDFGLRMTTNFGNFRVKYNNGSGNVSKSSSQGTINLDKMRTLNGSADFEFDIIFTYQNKREEPQYNGVILVNKYCTGDREIVNHFSENFSNAIEQSLVFQFANTPPAIIEYSEDRTTFTGKITSIPNDYTSTKTWYLKLYTLSDNQFSWNSTQIVYNGETILFDGNELFIEIGRPNSQQFETNLTFSILPLVDSTSIAALQANIGYYNGSIFNSIGGDVVRFTIEDNLPEYDEYSVQVLSNISETTEDSDEEIRLSLKFTRTQLGKKRIILDYIYADCLTNWYTYNNRTNIFSTAYKSGIFNTIYSTGININKYMCEAMCPITMNSFNTIQTGFNVQKTNINYTLQQDEEEIFYGYLEPFSYGRHSVAINYKYQHKNYVYHNGIIINVKQNPNIFTRILFELHNVTSDDQGFQITKKQSDNINVRYYEFNTNNTLKRNEFSLNNTLQYQYHINDRLVYFKLSTDNIQNLGNIELSVNNSSNESVIYKIHTQYTTKIFGYFSSILQLIPDEFQQYVNWSATSNNIISNNVSLNILLLHTNDNNNQIDLISSGNIYYSINELYLQNCIASDVNNLIYHIGSNNGIITVNSNILTDESITKLTNQNWTINYI